MGATWSPTRASRDACLLPGSGAGADRRSHAAAGDRVDRPVARWFQGGRAASTRAPRRCPRDRGVARCRCRPALRRREAARGLCHGGRHARTRGDARRADQRRGSGPAPAAVAAGAVARRPWIGRAARHPQRDRGGALGGSASNPGRRPPDRGRDARRAQGPPRGRASTRARARPRRGGGSHLAVWRVDSARRTA
jgi:hypothetical protein